MRDLRVIRLRTLAWLILPVTVVVFIPWGLQWVARKPFRWDGGFWPWIGVWLIANGVALAAWCVNLFNVQGQGTPLPLDPPKRFVLAGPYRYVRNPMMLGMMLILVGEALVMESRSVCLYALALALAAHLVVCCWEEPDLTRRFGQAYREYRKQVPRWIPRLPHR